jgi:hypothetical protein
MKRFALQATAAAILVAATATANAESNYVNGAQTSSPGAQAHVDFAIIIPKILYLRVGTGSPYWPANSTLASVGTVDLITFQPTAAVLGNGTAVSATAAPVSGDLLNGSVTAAIVSNSGDVTLKAVASGAMNDGVATDTINWTEILTASTTLNSATALPAPTLSNGTSANVVLTAPASKVIKQDAKWTYTYANTTVPPAGNYGGVNVNNSRITYTATMP